MDNNWEIVEKILQGNYDTEEIIMEDNIRMSLWLHNIKFSEKILGEKPKKEALYE